jgi:hypothetical protein
VFIRVSPLFRGNVRTLFGDGTFHQEHEKDERSSDGGKQKRRRKGGSIASVIGYLLIVNGKELEKKSVPRSEISTKAADGTGAS